MEKREKLILFFSLTIIALAAIAFVMLPRFLIRLKPHNPNFIGLSTHAAGEVRVKYGNSLSWRKLGKKDKIYSHSYLFTGPNSTSSFAFLDKSTIKLDSNSLVSLNFDVLAQDGSVELTPNGLPALKVGVLGGKVDMNLLKNSQIRKIEMDQSVLNVGEAPAALILETGDGDKVSVLDGKVSMKSKGETYNLKAGSKLAVKGDQAKKEEVPAELLAEMMKIARENDKRAYEEEMKKREFTYLVKFWYSYLFEKEE